MKQKQSKSTTLIGGRIEKFKTECWKEKETPESLDKLAQNIDNFYEGKDGLKALCENSTHELQKALEDRKAEILGKKRYLDQQTNGFLFSFGGAILGAILGPAISHVIENPKIISGNIQAVTVPGALTEVALKFALALLLLGALSLLLNWGFLRNFISSYCNNDKVDVLSSQNELRLIDRMMAEARKGKRQSEAPSEYHKPNFPKRKRRRR